MAWEHLFTIESEKRIEELYTKLLEYFTQIDYPFKIVHQQTPHHIRLKRGSHFVFNKSRKKWKSTINIFLRQNGNKSVVLLDYNVNGISDMMEVREKATIEVEQFRFNYL